MTTVVCWRSVADDGRVTLHFCSDSRFSDGKGTHWDLGRKLFFSRNFPDLFGFVGEALPPSVALNQLIDAIDSSSLGDRSIDPYQRMMDYKSHLDATIGTYPKQYSVEILFAPRTDEDSIPVFNVWCIFFPAGLGRGTARVVPIPGKSSVLVGSFGTGKCNFDKTYGVVYSKPQGSLSRGVYWAFVDHLASGKDKFSGGAPQIVRLRSKGVAIPVGISHNNKRYLLGIELKSNQLFQTRIEEWHDEKYQFIEPVTGLPRSGAQNIGRPIN